MGHLVGLYRHPIKSHGVEALEATELRVGECLPWDRHWAVAHEATQFDANAPAWASCRNFTIGAKANGLMAMHARMDAGAGLVHLSHPDLGELSIDPDTSEGSADLVNWTKNLIPENRAASTGIVKSDRGMTDTEFASVSINTMESLADLELQAGIGLDKKRFRGNLWIEGFEAWAERDWIGKRIQVGETILEVKEEIVRCRATTVDVVTGISNFDTLKLLNDHYGHQNFGVYTQVVTGGEIRLGDNVGLI